MHMKILPVRRPAPRSGSLRGFTLVELMIALAVSLIVALAAVGFVVSLIKANSENLKVTRLTQELRSLSEVMGREIRRARYVADPVGLIGSVGANNRDAITVNGTADCIVFSYDEPPDPPSPATTVSRIIRRDGNSIVLNPGSACPGASSDDVVISTPEVEITDLDFVRTNNSQVDITVVGKLANSPPDLTGVTRTFRQTIYVRSGQVN